MKTWYYLEPGDNGVPIERAVTEAEILKTYFPWWSRQMLKVGKKDQISEQSCIDDWVVVYWASSQPFLSKEPE